MFSGCCLSLDNCDLDNESVNGVGQNQIRSEKEDSIIDDDDDDDNNQSNNETLDTATDIRMVGRLLRHKLEWTLAPSSMKAAGRCNATAVADGKKFIYIMGGHDSKNTLKTIEQYDCDIKKWKVLKSELKYPVTGLAASMVGDIILTFGGFHESRCQASCNSYNVTTEKCHELPKMVHKRGGCASVILNGGVVCVIGGHDGLVHLDCAETLDMQNCDDWSNSSGSSNHIPNYNKPTWSLLSDQMNEARSNFGTAAINDVIYVVGGENDNGVLRSVEKFSDGKWSLLPAMKLPRRYCAVVGIEHFLVVVGGDNGVKEENGICVYDSSILFNTLTEEWYDETTTMPRMNICRDRASAVVMNHHSGRRIHVMGGFDNTKRCLSSMETCNVFHTVPLPPEMKQPPEMAMLNGNGKKHNHTNDEQVINDSIAVEGWIDGTNAAVNSYKSSIQTVARQVNADHVWKEKKLMDRIIALKQDIQRSGLKRDVFLSDMDKITNNWFRLQEKRLEIARNSIILPQELLQNHRANNNIVAIPSSDIPDELKCPITMETMKDPVIAADGISYERSAIEHVFMSAGITSSNSNINTAVVLSPKTGEPLSSHQLISNGEIRRKCREYGLLGFLEEAREDRESVRRGR